MRKHHLAFDAKDSPLVTRVTLGDDRHELASHLQLPGDVAARHADLLATGSGAPPTRRESADLERRDGGIPSSGGTHPHSM